MSAVKPIPPGMHTVTPYLMIRDAAAAIEFYKAAFGAQEMGRMMLPDGKKIMHAQIKIGDSVIMMADEMPTCSNCCSPSSLEGTSVALHIYSEDVDKAFAKAIAAGGQALMTPTDMFWGDRYSRLVDPYGHQWSIATHVKDLTPEDMAAGARECAEKMAAMSAE